MGWMGRIRAFMRRDQVTEDIDEELDFHLAMREQWNVEQGMPRREARRDARMRFGSPVKWRERLSEIDFLMLPQTVWQDLRFGMRLLVRTPGFTLAAVFALGIGIGVNTSAFTMYKAVFGRALDARDSINMMNISLILQSGQLDSWFSYPDYLFYRDHSRVMEGLIAADSPETLTMTGAESLGGQRVETAGTLVGRLGLIPPSALATVDEPAMTFPVSENYFAVLGVPAIQGRAFDAMTATELAGNPAVLISENYWQRRFRGNPAILGKSVRLNGVAFTIIGITPHDFVGTSVGAPDFWMPLSLQPLVHPGENLLTDREKLRYRLFGRRKPGVSLAEAAAEMTLLSNQLAKLHDPHSDQSKPGTMMIWPGSPFPRKLDAALSFAILLIMIAVGMVMVIACANVACLQLARAASRQNELRMRMSLGASRVRLIRQLLTESALLAVFSGALALLVTWGVLKVVANVTASALPPEYGSLILHVTPDLGIFTYVFAISVLAGVLFGLTPALESSRSALPSSLKANAGSSPGRSRRLRSVLIGGQVAASLVLLISGAMLVRSSRHALKMQSGYDGRHSVDVELLYPRGPKYTATQKLELVRELKERLKASPGVKAVTVGRPPNGGGVRSASVSIDGQAPSERNTRAQQFYTYVQGNYFETLGIPLLVGRAFASASERSVVLSESSAQRIWPGQSPLGRSLRIGSERDFHADGELVPGGDSFVVIGVAKDTQGPQLDGRDNEQIYLPLAEERMADYPILVRTEGDPAALIAGVGPLLTAIDNHVGVVAITLDAMMMQTPRFIVAGLAASIASAIGLVGLLLVSMGIYGTVNYMVVLRQREVGIRMALGAKRRDVLALIMGDNAKPVAAGLLAGLVLSMGASYLLRAILYGMGIFDTVAYGSVTIFLLGIAMAAAYLPSRRAMQVDPVVALRCE